MEEEIKKGIETATEEENKSAISADLIRGHINTIILRTLYERDKYGYEIIEEIENKSHGQYSLKQPTLYSALKRLESQGYINAYWKTDEVSNGGRRKYYTLTDSGREITEKNQSEWDYSRTVIDSLISDKNFDFTQPPPSAVDFKILKTSTTRVPSVKSEESEKVEEPKREVKYEEESTVSVTAEQYEIKPEPIVEQPAVADVPITRETETAASSVVETQNPQPEVAPPTPVLTQPTPEQIAEERRIHENYLKLISEPVAPTEEPSTNPNSANINTEKLIYNRKPETERDYKNLIDNLFVRTVRQQPQREQSSTPVQKQEFISAQPAVNYEDASVKASKDGLTVNSSDFVVSSKRKAKYNRGAALFKSSLIIAVVMLVEFALSLAFKDQLGVSIGYPIVILVLGVAQLLIFGILATTDFGKSTRKPASHSYLTTTVVLAIIAIMIIFVVSLLLNVNFANAGDVLAKIIIPGVVALNLPIFSTVFYTLSK